MANNRQVRWSARTLSLAGALFLAGSGRAAPPLPPPPSPRTAARIRARAGAVNLTLRQVELRRTVTARLDAPGKPEAEAEVRLEFRLTAPSAPDVEAVLRGETPPSAHLRVVDDRGRESRRVRVEVLEVEDEPLLRLTAEGLSPDATRLRLVEGELTAYPEVRRVRFHVPWSKDDVPLSVDYQGARATLQRFQLVEEDSTLWVSVRPPDGFRVAPFNSPGALSAQAVDMYGNLVNGGGITQIDQTRGTAEPEFRFEAPAMRRTPARLVLDVLCIAGQPRPVPFSLQNVPLPKASLKR